MLLFTVQKIFVTLASKYDDKIRVPIVELINGIIVPGNHFWVRVVDILIQL